MKIMPVHMYDSMSEEIYSRVDLTRGRDCWLSKYIEIGRYCRKVSRNTEVHNAGDNGRTVNYSLDKGDNSSYLGRKGERERERDAVMRLTVDLERTHELLG